MLVFQQESSEEYTGDGWMDGVAARRETACRAKPTPDSHRGMLLGGITINGPLDERALTTVSRCAHHAPAR